MVAAIERAVATAINSKSKPEFLYRWSSVGDDLELTNEELKSLNEEAISVNEEFRRLIVRGRQTLTPFVQMGVALFCDSGGV
jgi:hypothetical protein